MVERRKLQRHPLVKNVKIMIANQASPIECIICNLTSHGACLRFAATMHAPEIFEISLDNFRSVRTCRVAWRNAERLGVAFR